MTWLSIVSFWMGGACAGFVLGFLSQQSRLKRQAIELESYRQASWELGNKLVRVMVRLQTFERNADQD